jgi:hypothetical protein
VVGGLLLAPRPSQGQTPGGAPLAAPDGSPGGAAAGDLSPRTGSPDHAAGADPAGTAPEATGALPGELSLAELFPSEVALGAAAPDGSPQASGVAPLVQGGQIGTDSSRSSHSRWSLIAGLIVTLAVLIFGGGFLWWRNRDSAFFPA